jgi:hypothetical protein
MRRLVDTCGPDKLAALKPSDIQRFYDSWTEGGKIAMGHSLITMLRALASFGTTVLEDSDCERLSMVLHNMRFSVARSQKEQLTADHVKKIISKAHEMGRSSIALAQAFQFDCTLRQKDVIGEWVPHGESGVSDVTHGKKKWLRGLRWSEIDRDLTLRHVTSRGGKLIEKRLSEAPLVKAEFERIGALPQSGPIIVSEFTGLPYTAAEFRRWWRKVADAAGVPKNVKNMDSRSATDDDTETRTDARA